MDRNLDRSLDEILSERQPSRRGGRGSRSHGFGGSDTAGGRRRDRVEYPRDRVEYPRDGVRKSFRDEAPRNIDSEWQHDRYDESGSQRSNQRRNFSPDASRISRGTKLRVDNIHYELTEDDLKGLFGKIGPLVNLELRYDRAGRSDGTAFVTYESHRDAKEAIAQFDGANAAGQPINLTLLPSGPHATGGGAGSSNRRNPFDTAVMPGRPLSERITKPGNQRSRSLSPTRRELDDEEAARKGIDRYRPGGRGGSRSPAGTNRRREGGRRPGARREGGGVGRGHDRASSARGGGRTREKKTAEELDAEMMDYFGGGSPAQKGAGINGTAHVDNPAVAAPPVLTEDVEMIE
ncbi:hypothetical protein P8C59_006960 [Phyllachora maydis]|uniref:RRM domain-containing protein n=1 Tax=Phyllachora maydis TaxID=1825666 RepID=A0AAD9I7D0_9PEZI|nr:hypothetical protein P8C59_006960 [Phyllachora maydis]